MLPGPGDGCALGGAGLAVAVAVAVAGFCDGLVRGMSLVRVRSGAGGVLRALAWSYWVFRGGVCEDKRPVGYGFHGCLDRDARCELLLASGLSCGLSCVLVGKV